MGSAAAAGTMACRAHAGRVACTRAYVIAAYRQLARRQARSYARPIGSYRRHRRPCLGHPKRYPLAGKRIDVPPGIADQEHPAGDSAGNSLPEWAGPAICVAAEALASLPRSCGNSLSCSSNGTRRALSTATPTRLSRRG